jgi:hypothetical protein
MEDSDCSRIDAQETIPLKGKEKRNDFLFPLSGEKEKTNPFNWLIGTDLFIYYPYAHINIRFDRITLI